MTLSATAEDTLIQELLPATGSTLAVARAGARQRRFVWLDGDGSAGQRSYLTWNPHRVVRAWGDLVLDERWAAGRYTRQRYRRRPWQLLAELLPRREERHPDGFPGPVWHSGAVVALGFELYRWTESLPPLPPRGKEGNLPRTPDLYLAFYDSVLMLDESRGERWLLARLPEHRDPSGVLTTFGPDGAPPRLDTRQARTPGSTPLCPRAEHPEPWPARLDFGRYARALGRIRDALEQGEVYQVNFSYPLRLHWPYSALDLVTSHHELGRVPYAALVDMGDQSICSFSPESFLWRHGNELRTAPIKGTRPRGDGRVEDRRLSQALLESHKDRAEHIMIVDLERNDLGRVCEPGSIRVDPLLALQSFPAVHHLVSTVHGTVRNGVTTAELLRATFPSGSVTGAPKKRAVELIRELEQAPRHFYTGAIGFVDATGDMVLNVAIRTAQLAGGELDYRIGGGIVIDSDPRAEWEETRDKARSFLRAARTTLAVP